MKPKQREGESKACGNDGQGETEIATRSKLLRAVDKGGVVVKKGENGGGG